MKKLFVLILALLMLCACGVEEEPANEPILEQEDQISSENMPGEEKLSAEQLQIKKAIEENLNENYSFYAERKAKFEELGITFSISNIEVKDDQNWTATITLKREDFELPIDISGIHLLLESEDYKSNEYYWGTFLFTGNNSIVFCGKEKAVFFDDRTLEPLIAGFEFEENTWVNGASYVPEKEAFYIFTSSVYEDSADEYANVLKYSFDGKLINERETKVPVSSEFYGKFYPHFMEKAVIFEIDGDDFVNSGYRFCGIGNEKTYYIEKITGAKAEYYKELEIYNFYNEDYGTDFRDGNHIAFLFECGNLLNNYFCFTENNISTVYGIEDEISLFGVDDVYIYYSDHFAMSLELDFANKTHKLIYNPTDKHTFGGLYGTKSPNGKYTVCIFGETSGGDAYYCHTAIRNNETGKYIYIGENGGIWGGTGGNGFFKNNDFYSWTNHELKVLNPETGEIKFDINDNFKLGYDEKNDSERGILTFRRDPNDMTFIVVYYEYENGFEWKEIESNVFGITSHLEGSCNYKIGFLDSEGNLLASYDTGVPLWGEIMWGLHSVDMFYSAENSTITLTVKNVGKGNSNFTGVFDMKTKEFSITSLNKRT